MFWIIDLLLLFWKETNRILRFDSKWKSFLSVISAVYYWQCERFVLELHAYTKYSALNIFVRICMVRVFQHICQFCCLHWSYISTSVSLTAFEWFNKKKRQTIPPKWIRIIFFSQKATINLRLHHFCWTFSSVSYHFVYFELFVNKIVLGSPAKCETEKKANKQYALRNVCFLPIQLSFRNYIRLHQRSTVYMHTPYARRKRAALFAEDGNHDRWSTLTESEISGFCSLLFGLKMDK